MIATWLHLVAGLSRDATNLMLKTCRILITMSLELGFLMAQATYARENGTSVPADLNHGLYNTNTFTGLPHLFDNLRLTGMCTDTNSLHIE